MVSASSLSCPSAGTARTWHVYVLECEDGSLYTGIAIDVAARFAQHLAGTGAKYTRAHRPLRVLASFPHPDRSSATKAELAIKKLAPAQKRLLCAAATA